MLLLPYPQEIKREGIISLNTNNVLIVLGERAGRRGKIAADELAVYIDRLTGKKPGIIRTNQKIPSESFLFILGELDSNRFILLAEKKGLIDRKYCKYGPQGYQIVYYKGVEGMKGHGLLLVGNAPMGTYYAVKTVKQLISIVDGKLRMRKVKIRDYPLLNDRGVNPYCDEDHEVFGWGMKEWKNFIDWMSDIKLNCMMLPIFREGLRYDSRVYPELVDRNHPFVKKRLLEPIIKYAHKKGIRMLLTISHIDGFPILRKVYPETKNQGAPDFYGNGLCFSHHKTLEVIYAIIKEIVERFSFDELNIWPGESCTACKCSKCQKEAEAIRQVRILYHAYLKAKKTKPGLTLRFLPCAPQYFYAPEVFKIIPKKVKLDFYMDDYAEPIRGTEYGVYSYDISDEAIVFSDTARNLIKKGYQYSCLAAFGRLAWQGVPLPIPSSMKRKAQIIVEEGGMGMVGNIGDMPTAYRVNISAAAEYAWNPYGRDVIEFLTTYAKRCGYKNFKKIAVYYTLLEKASKTVALINNQPMGGFYSGTIRVPGKQPFSNIDRIRKEIEGDFYNAKELYLKPLEKAKVDVDRAIEIADAVKDELLVAKAKLISYLCKIMMGICNALYVYADTIKNKKVSTQWKRKISVYLKEAEEALDSIDTVWGIVREHNYGDEIAPFTDYRDAIQKIKSEVGLVDIARSKH